jgi:hypothetical protein
MPETPVPIDVFCFYETSDEDLFRDLKTHLNSLLRTRRITLSTNHPNEAGVDEREYITEHLAKAALVLLLVSPRFLASDDASSIEMIDVMKRQRAREVLVVPILIKPVIWKDEVFAHLKVLPTGNKCVVQWGDKDEAFVDIVSDLRRALDNLPHSISPFPPVPAPIEPRRVIQPVSPSPALISAAPPLLSATAVDMIRAKRAAKTFDVFLCHNEDDKPAVRRINALLKAQGILPWFDEDELRPGIPWKKLLEAQIDQIKSAAVFVGKSDIGPWQEQTLYAFLDEFVTRQCPVIPVLFSDVGQTPILPKFLKAMTWVDFRQSESDALSRLIWGITGERPES